MAASSLQLDDNGDFNDQHNLGKAFYHYATIFNTSNITTAPHLLTDDRCNISQTGTAQNIAYTVFMVLILLASFFGNTLVVLSSLLSKQLRSRVTVYFIISLAISDLAFAVSIIPFQISMKLHQYFCHSVAACYWMIISDAFCNVASILNLFLIAIDRFIAVRYPFRYTFILSPSRAKKLIAFVWMFSAIWSIGGIFKWERNSMPGIYSVQKKQFCSNKNYYFYAASFGVYLMPLFVMTLTYLSILHTAITHIKAIEATHIELHHRKESISDSSHFSQVTVVTQRNSQVTLQLQRNKKARQRKRKKELKATKSVAIVYFAFILCWLPACIINIIITADSSYFPKLQKANKTLFLFIYYAFVQILPVVNTMVNPLIYSFSNKQFQQAFVMLYKRVFKKPNVDKHSIQTENRRSREENTVEPSSPASCSTQSINSSKLLPWSPTSSTGKPKLMIIKGSFVNTSIDSEMNSNSSAAIWKPD